MTSNRKVKLAPEIPEKRPYTKPILRKVGNLNSLAADDPRYAELVALQEPFDRTRSSR